MNIVLVCINNFQEYILDNIAQLIKLEHEYIYVLTNEKFFNLFDKFNEKIKLINIDNLTDTFNFYSKTTLNKTFRSGFWTLTSLRFFYIYEFMKQHNIKDVVHIENDVLIYYNCNSILNIFDKNYIYLPFDTFERNIASIMYIPSHEILKIVLDNYDFKKNDMQNFCSIKNKTKIIKTLPIFPKTNTDNDEINYVSENYTNFNYIFDAAAIGQFLGGVDPRNDNSNTIGFVNETCVIKYNMFNVFFEYDNGIIKPYINIENIKYKIFNLHIHSKNLKKFT
jgi:hypothetical protein